MKKKCLRAAYSFALSPISSTVVSRKKLKKKSFVFLSFSLSRSLLKKVYNFLFHRLERKKRSLKSFSRIVGEKKSLMKIVFARFSRKKDEWKKFTVFASRVNLRALSLPAWQSNYNLIKLLLNAIILSYHLKYLRFYYSIFTSETLLWALTIPTMLSP